MGENRVCVCLSPGEGGLYSAPLAPVEQGDPNLDMDDETVDGGFRIKQASWRR